MKNNSILIISNNQDVGNEISNKIKLLRECDVTRVVSFIEAISVLNSTQPSIIILYCSNTDSTGIVKEIRSIKSLDKVPIIFVMDNLVEDILFYAFDNGIDDFFFLNDPDSIILMRIFLTLQKSVLYKQIEIHNQILVQTKILDKESNIYLKEQAPVVLRNFFSKSIEENLDNTVFMYIKPLPIEKKHLNMSKISSVVRAVPRGNDIVAYGKGAGFYLILYNAGLAGAKSVAQRIKTRLEKECQIYANAAEITTSFEEMEPILYQCMKNQITTGLDFNYLYDLKEGNYTETVMIRDENGKKFKEFKSEFFKNFEKIVAPVFYQIQTKYTEKFPEAQINFEISESESKLTISQNKFESEMCITYPTYLSLIIDIKHMSEDENPVYRRLTFDFEDFSEDKLSSILTDMINEFSQRVSLNTLKQTE